MAAGSYDIIIEQGATYLQDLFWYSDTQPSYPKNVVGYTGKMQVRSAVGVITPYLTLISNPPPTQIGVVDDPSVPTGQIFFGDIDGRITLYITAATTLGFTWTKAVYDLDVVSPGGFVTRVLQGNITVLPTVTDI